MTTYALMAHTSDGCTVVVKRFIDRKRAEAEQRRLQKRRDDYFAPGSVKRLSVRVERV